MAYNFLLDGDDEYYLILGKSVSAWAKVEFLIDCLSATCFKGMNGNAELKEAPQNYKRKVKFIRSTLATDERTKQYHGDIDALFDKADELNEIRKILVHGNIIGKSETDLPYVLFSYSTDGHAAKRKAVSQDIFVDHPDLCIDLANELANTLVAILQKLVPDFSPELFE